MENKTLFVADLDGTLLNRKDSISQYSLDRINHLIDQGVSFTYATARSLISASKVSKGLNVNLPVIVYNGAFIMESNTSEIIYSCKFEDREIRSICAILKKNDVYPIVYSFVEGKESVNWYMGRVNEGMQYYLNNRKGDKRFNPIKNIHDLYKGKVFYFTCIGEEKDLRPLYESLLLLDFVTCTFQQELYREEYWLEIMPKQATKANAISYLKKRLGYEKVVSFGDAINDLPMFSISDEAYAMGNAVSQLKEVANAILEDNDHDGVALFLQNRFLK